MKVHANEIFKRNFQFILFVLVTIACFASIAVNLKTISKLNRPLIIGIDSNGTRIVTESDDPIFKTEAISFIQRFLFNIYNFDAENFLKRIGFATTLMSEELWRQKRAEVLELKSKVERDEIVVSGQILKMTLDDSGIYHGLVVIKEKSRMSEQDHKIEIAIKLKPSPRSQENPFGLEVDSYEETLVHD